MAACLLACVVAGYLSALQQIPGGGLADMANPIQLILCNNIGNLVPVDGCVIHSNTPFKITFAGATVRVLPRRNKFRLLRFPQSENQSPASLFLLSAKSHARLACSVASALTTARCRYQLFAGFSLSGNCGIHFISCVYTTLILFFPFFP